MIAQQKTLPIFDPRRISAIKRSSKMVMKLSFMEHNAQIMTKEWHERSKV
ncbi:hypothetical protein [Gluconobacter wancherniae]|nr:hypothetical protein [Gluconobacter wancherniae]MBS1088013.1 hypothetical protein [Gluconobacter wancherniae]